MIRTWQILSVLLAACGMAAAFNPESRPKGFTHPRDPEDGPFEVTRLPGYDGNLPSLHRAGYVTVAPEAGRRLYYYLVNSESPTPDQDPLVVWLTGGPGCSSLDAFTYENGPFIFDLSPGASKRRGAPQSADDVTLRRNPNSWSRAAHILYVDSPAGTGMSYSTNRDSEYRTDDHQTIEDLLQLVLGVLSDVPDIRGRDIYLAGESYGGVYIPLLAHRILHYNHHLEQQQQQQQPQKHQQQQQSGQEPQTASMAGHVKEQPMRQAFQGDTASSGASAAADGQSTSLPHQHVSRQLLAASYDRGYHHRVNLVGYMVGNGVTDDEVDGNSLVPFAWFSGLLDSDTYDFVSDACKGSYWNATRGSKCWEALDVVDAAIGDINPYDIIAPCFFTRPPRYDSPAASGGSQQRVWPAAARFEKGQPVGNWWKAERAQGGKFTGEIFDKDWPGPSQLIGHTVPCADRRAALAYYNDPEVRRAVHAAPEDITGRWEPCSDVLHYTHTAPSMIAVHRHLVRSGLRALIYSGLQDYVVPFTGTRAWTAGLELPIEFPWRPWKMGRQVAGHAVRYRAEGEGPLTFATVIGAGHMVPQTSPQHALALLQEFLSDKV